ncbi:MAG: histidine phosphatase family protein [Acidimicrobiia bacterium]
MLHLMLMRHGKSDWDAGAPDDHTRPLNERGIRASQRMGVVIRDLGIVPDIVVSSTATRARSTAEIARLAGGWSSRLVLDGGLYGCSVEDALTIAAGHGATTERVMLVGHQPVWGMLVRRLTGASTEMKTASVADIEIQASAWDELPASHGIMTQLLQAQAFLTPD